jgi:hypothetical protein
MTARSPLGPRGLALLGLTGALGIVLAVHGWSTRHTPTAYGALGGSAAASTTPAATPSATPGASQGPQASKPGPLLSSQSFAQYSFLIWPGQPSNSAKLALAGLNIEVQHKGSGLSVTAGVNGQPATAPHFYASGARVYVVEASMGDDSGNSDYNLGDDGLIVTNAQGRILQ